VDALERFQRLRSAGEAAQTQFEIARTKLAQLAPTTECVEALEAALDLAEKARHNNLVRKIEVDLSACDEAAFCRRLYWRVRGSIYEDTASLVGGRTSDASILFLDLERSTEAMLQSSAAAMLLALNGMVAAFEDCLDEHGAAITTFLGDGFMVVVRGTDHAPRALKVALELGAALEDLNRPRRVLGKPLLCLRVGVASGEVVLGNVGSYRKMDFTAVGIPVNLASRLQFLAQSGAPCISEATHELVKDQFEFGNDNPRTVDVKGLGQHRVWDVAGVK